MYARRLQDLRISYGKFARTVIEKPQAGTVREPRSSARLVPSTRTSTRLASVE